MLIADMFRGTDSTGCFGVNKHGNLKWIKDASSTPFFLNKKETANYMSDFISDFHIMVGHNRKATMGVVTSENAHPFVEGNICLVHNGTLTNHKNLADTTVDSHAICHHINEHGYKSMFKNIDGAYALIWYDAEEKTVYFARNSERPLHLVETDTKIYLASEEKMLDWILGRNNISKYQIELVPTDKIFKFSLETRKLECETKPKKEKAFSTVGRDWMQELYGHNNNRKFHKKSQQQSNLSLVHSSPDSSVTPKASIETYESGSKINVKCVDFDINDTHTKLVLETLDGLNTSCIRYLPHDRYSQADCDKFINAKKLVGTIQHITSKRGVITIYLRELAQYEEWTARGGVIVDPQEFQDMGGACWQCGVVLDKKEDVEFAEVSVDSSGSITYILCEHCADQMSHISSYRSQYNGDC